MWHRLIDWNSPQHFRIFWVFLAETAASSCEFALFFRSHCEVINWYELSVFGGNMENKKQWVLIFVMWNINSAQVGLDYNISSSLLTRSLQVDLKVCLSVCVVASKSTTKKNCFFCFLFFLSGSSPMKKERITFQNKVGIDSLPSQAHPWQYQQLLS